MSYIMQITKSAGNSLGSAGGILTSKFSSTKIGQTKIGQYMSGKIEGAVSSIADSLTSGGFDVSELAHDVVYTTSIQGQAGKLTFTLEHDPNGILRLEIGDTVKFYDGVTPVFKGKIFNLGTDSTDCYRVVAYDNLRYFKNHDYVFRENMSIGSFFAKICGFMGLPFEIKADGGTLKDELFSDKSYYDMMQATIEETLIESGKLFFIRDNFGILQLCEVAGNAQSRSADVSGINGGGSLKAFVKNKITSAIKSGIQNAIGSIASSSQVTIGDGSLLTGYNYELDIDRDMFNEVYVHKNLKKDKTTSGEPKNVAVLAQARKPIVKWGKIRKIIQVDGSASEAQMLELAQTALAVGAKITKTMRLDALGVSGLNAGDAFNLSLKKLNINCLMYIIAATHRYDADVHTMSLDVSTNSEMTEVLGSGDYSSATSALSSLAELIRG